MAKPKAESSKIEKDKTPTKPLKTETSTTRTFRKSPARASEKRKSPDRIANVSSTSPSGRASIRSSPSRRSPSRRSPGRRSPGRSPARKSPVSKKPLTPGRRSPGRPPKVDKAESEKSGSTGRRSPGRPPKTDKQESDKPKPTSTRPRRNVIEKDSDSDGIDANYLSNPDKPKAAVRGRARRLDSDYTSPHVLLHDIEVTRDVPRVDREIGSYVGLVRRSLRKSLSREPERIVHLRHNNDSAVKKLTELSDDDDIILSSRSQPIRETSEPRVFEDRIPKTEFGGWIIALLLILSMPMTIISLFVFCNKTQCSFTKLPNLQPFKKISTYVDTTALLIYSAFCILMAILTALPFGGLKVSGLPNKQGKLNYVTNGFFAVVVTSALVLALEFYNVPVTSFIIQKHFQLVSTSVIIAVLFSIYLYIRSFFVPISALNPHAISTSRIYNFWIGREVNPRYLGIMDIKLFLLKIFAAGVVIINATFIYKNIRLTKLAETASETASYMDSIKSVDFNPTLLVISILQIIYAVDWVIFEHAFLSSFEIQYEGVGYMSSLLGFPAPFIVTLLPKYIFDHGVRYPAYQLAAASALFLLGYLVYRGSNLQKHKFRQNPYNPAISHLESIPTAQGKKLLVSGFWGFVRHPNYLGDMLMWLSLASFVSNVPPLVVVLMDYLFLIHRAHRDGARCRQRYGTAWDRYCQRVKHVLIPYIY